MAVDEAVEKQSRRRRKAQNEDVTNDTEERGLTEGKGTATPGRRNRSGKKKDEGGNFIKRSANGIIEYIQGVRDELDKVVWPTREELFRLAWIVAGVTIAAALALGLISIAFTELFALGLQNEWVFVGFGGLCVLAYIGYKIWANRKGAQTDESQLTY